MKQKILELIELADTDGGVRENLNQLLVELVTDDYVCSIMGQYIESRLDNISKEALHIENLQPRVHFSIKNGVLDSIIVKFPKKGSLNFRTQRLDAIMYWTFITKDGLVKTNVQRNELTNNSYTVQNEVHKFFGDFGYEFTASDKSLIVSVSVNGERRVFDSKDLIGLRSIVQLIQPQ